MTKATKWEYQFGYVHAAVITEERAFGLGAAKEVASSHDFEKVREVLNVSGGVGWELVDMEPDWHYAREHISGAMSITRPLAVKGWYMTFKRPKSVDDGPNAEKI